MTEAEIRTAFAEAARPHDAGFSDAVSRRLAVRRRWRMALAVAMGASAIACLALLIAGLGGMAGLFAGTPAAPGGAGLAALAFFVFAAILILPLANRDA